MNSFRFVPVVACVVLLTAAPIAPGRAAGPERATAPPSAIGTWTGSSTCVGDRPACKNENVVYRIVPVAGAAAKVRMYADKILDGKRVPMGALDFVVNGARLSCDFTIGRTHGLWEFTVAGDTMEGTLVLLPERDLGRRVAVRRVAEDRVPPPPPDEDYGPPLGSQ